MRYAISVTIYLEYIHCIYQYSHYFHNSIVEKKCRNTENLSRPSYMRCLSVLCSEINLARGL